MTTTQLKKKHDYLKELKSRLAFLSPSIHITENTLIVDIITPKKRTYRYLVTHIEHKISYGLMAYDTALRIMTDYNKFLIKNS